MLQSLSPSLQGCLRNIVSQISGRSSDPLLRTSVHDKTIRTLLLHSRHERLATNNWSKSIHIQHLAKGIHRFVQGPTSQLDRSVIHKKVNTPSALVLKYLIGRILHLLLLRYIHYEFLDMLMSAALCMGLDEWERFGEILGVNV